MGLRSFDQPELIFWFPGCIAFNHSIFLNLSSVCLPITNFLYSCHQSSIPELIFCFPVCYKLLVLMTSILCTFFLYLCYMPSMTSIRCLLNICHSLSVKYLPTETIKTPGILQQLSIPSQHWEEVSMDFITGLPKSEGKSVIMVIVYRLTKYTHFCALSHPFKSIIVATTFMEIVQKLHGSPKIIVSDRDHIFTGHFGQNYFLVWVLNWLISHPIILNRMDKPR